MKEIDDAFDWDDSPLWGPGDEALLDKAVMLRRAPSGGYGETYAGGQFIPATAWNREKAAAKASLPDILKVFGKQMQYLRKVWEAQTELGENPPKSMPTPGETRWMMKTVIRQTYEQAFIAGKRAGGNLFSPTDDDKRAIKKVRLDEFRYLEKFMSDMATGAGVMDYRERMNYYTKAARELFWLGFVRADLDTSRKIVWHINPEKEHCKSCLDAEAAGEIPADEFWRDYASKGILPKSGALDCLGYRCGCWLTDVRPEVSALKVGRGSASRN